MPRLLYLQHGESEGPGLLAATLLPLGVELETVHLWAGQAVPRRAEKWAAVVSGGGAMSAWQTEEFPFLQAERDFLQEARRAQVPLLGLCLGAQQMAAAFGGQVFRHGVKEIGFYPLHFTPAAREDPLWAPYAAGFSPAQWHGDTFSLPPEATLLASSPLTPHQLFSLEGRHYGLQFHLELDLATARGWIQGDAAALQQYGVDPARLQTEAEEGLPALEPMAREFFARWWRQVAPAGAAR